MAARTYPTRYMLAYHVKPTSHQSPTAQKMNLWPHGLYLFLFFLCLLTYIDYITGLVISRYFGLLFSDILLELASLGRIGCIWRLERFSLGWSWRDHLLDIYVAMSLLFSYTLCKCSLHSAFYLLWLFVPTASNFVQVTVLCSVFIFSLCRLLNEHGRFPTNNAQFSVAETTVTLFSRVLNVCISVKTSIVVGQRLEATRYIKNNTRTTNNTSFCLL